MAVETNNIDLAAYLKLRGIEPERVTTTGEKGFRRFWFPDAARVLMQAYWDDAPVPVRSFTLARADLKRVPVEHL